MKKQFVTPKIDFVKIDFEDLITTSGNDFQIKEQTENISVAGSPRRNTPIWDE